jgi:ABC-type nitrate/sulfonate/bicarbonate transport system substrate-binding protein
MLISRRTAALSILATPALFSRAWGEAAPDKIRLGQPTNSLSFLKTFASRALDTFAAENIALEYASIPGGDPAVLAAVDSGDLELAAVGSDTALAAIAKGQPFKIIYTLMNRLPYELTVSKTFLAKSGVTIDAPLDKRLGVLQTAVVGVTALGGAQDRVARWLATQGGIDPKTIKLAAVGSPPALGAALENGRIDAFVLSPPESTIAVERDYGVVLVHPSKEIAGTDKIPSLVLAARADPTPEVRDRIVRSLRAMNQASSEVLADPNKAAGKIAEKFFSKIPASIIRASVNTLADGLTGEGRLSDESIAALLKFSTQTGGAAPQAKDFWTNSYVEAALKKA